VNDGISVGGFGVSWRRRPGKLKSG